MPFNKISANFIPFHLFKWLIWNSTYTRYFRKEMFSVMQFVSYLLGFTRSYPSYNRRYICCKNLLTMCKFFFYSPLKNIISALNLMIKIFSIDKNLDFLKNWKMNNHYPHSVSFIPAFLKLLFSSANWFPVITFFAAH